MSKAEAYVYLYRDAQGVPRYVGKGTGTRGRAHIQLAAAFNEGRRHERIYHFTRWLAKCLREHRAFSFEFVQKGMTDEDAFLLEGLLILMYGRFREPGGTLYNHNAGGDGFTSADAKRLGNLPRTKERQRIARERLLADPAFRARLKATTKEANGRPYRRVQSAEKARAQWADPKQLAAQKRRATNNWASGVHEVNRAKLKALNAARWRDPAYREQTSTFNQLQHLANPARTERFRANVRSWNERRKATQ